MLKIEVHLRGRIDVMSACDSADISENTHYDGRKRYGGMARASLTEFKALRRENERLKKIFLKVELDRLILKESLDCLKLKA